MNINTYLTSQEQARFASASIGIAGLGGLGSNVLAHLVRSGLENFVGVDFDTVAASNLNRQFFFPDQIGMKKTEAVAENVRRINPHIRLTLYDERLTRQNAPLFFKDCDIVVEAFDDASAKMELIETMQQHGKIVVAASGLAGFGHSGKMRLQKMGERLYVVGDGRSAISADLAPMSPRVGIAAAMQANTVLALLLGLEP